MFNHSRINEAVLRLLLLMLCNTSNSLLSYSYCSFEPFVRLVSLLTGVMVIIYRYLPKRLVLTILMLLACIVFSGQVRAEMRVFELQHRSAGELAEMVREFVDDDAKVAAHRNTLVINASPAELAEIASLVASYDRAQRMLRVTVKQGSHLDDQNRELNTSGRLRSGSVAVDLNNPGRGDGGSIFITSGGNRINVQAQDYRRQEDRNVSQFITVIEGYPATITVGKAVPFTSQMRTYCRQHPAFVETIDYQNVDTGFEVLPEVYGETVQLEIRPFMAFLDSQNSNQIIFHELATKVRLPLGTWYDLGGQMSTQDGLSREILGAGRHSSGSGNSIRVRVDPEN